MNRIIKHKYIIALLLLVVIPSCSRGRARAQSDSTGTDTIVTHRVTLLFAGDLMQHITQINAAKTANGTYDYSSYFDKVSTYIQSFDLAVANLEVTLGGKPYSGYPRFCAPDEYLYAIKDAGFDILETANNHSVDSGKKGIERTVQMLDSLQIPHFGTYINQQEREKNYPLIVEKNGIKIAFLNYTYDTNGIPIPAPNIVNIINKDQMSADIMKAKAQSPDVIIACMHWGIEYAMVPNAAQRELADWLFSQGVTHIIGGHPHVVQPLELRADANGDKHLLAYSLGNFISNQWMENSDGGMVVSLTLEKDSVTRLTDCNYSLVWVSRPPVSHQKNHRIYPVDNPSDKLNAEERRKMGVFSRNARNLFKKHNVGNIKEHIIQ